jgi:hypothetical protein
VSFGITIEMIKDVLNKGAHGLDGYEILSQVDEIMNNPDSAFPSGKSADKEIDDNKTPDLSVGKSSLQENLTTTLRNHRALLQKFNIRVIVYPDRVEIKGGIPTQILDKTDKEKTAWIICSPCRGREGVGGWVPFSWYL